MDIQSFFELITSDFCEWCKRCVTISAREWSKPPHESQIIDIPLELKEHQRRYVEYLESDISDKVVLKTRQRGYSVISLLYCFWKILYKRNENIIYTIDKDKKCLAFINTIKTVWQRMPDIAKPGGVKITSSGLITHTTRNNTLRISTVGDGGIVRSGTQTQTFLDEIAWYDRNTQANVMSGLTSSCPNNRVFISTPRQENDLYHTLCLEAEAAGTIFKHGYWDYIDDWFGSKEVAQAWRKEQEKGLTPTQIIRELDCQFRGAAENLIWTIDPECFLPASVAPGERVIVGMDLGFNPDPTALLYATDRRGFLHIYTEDLVQQYTILQVARVIKDRGNPIKYAVMDSSGKKTDQTSGISSWARMKQLLARPIYTKKLPDKIELQRIANTALLGGKVKIDSTNCPFLMEMLYNYEWKHERIPHNKYSHIHDALVYLIYNWLQIPKTKSQNVRIHNQAAFRFAIP